MSKTVKAIICVATFGVLGPPVGWLSIFGVLVVSTVLTRTIFETSGLLIALPVGAMYSYVFGGPPAVLLGCYVAYKAVTDETLGRLETLAAAAVVVAFSTTILRAFIRIGEDQERFPSTWTDMVLLAGGLALPAIVAAFVCRKILIRARVISERH